MTKSTNVVDFATFRLARDLRKADQHLSQANHPEASTLKTPAQPRATLSADETAHRQRMLEHLAGRLFV